jgi:hypothetical protein
MKQLRSIRRILAVLLATSAWMGLVGPVQARSGDEVSAWMESAIQIAERDDDGERMSRSEAARRARSRHGGGRVLSVDEADDSGYRVKLLDKGTVRTIRVDEDERKGGSDDGGKRGKKRRKHD